MEDYIQELAKRPRVNLGGHTHDVGPVLYVGAHRYEIDERTALYWASTLNNYLWDKMAHATQPTGCMDGDK